MKPWTKRDIIWVKKRETLPRVQNLAAEEPLSIRVQGEPYAVVMRTPGEELAHAAGFCLGEGLVDRLKDISALAFCDGGDTNTVTVTLTPDRRQKVADLLNRRGYVSRTSCGLCGKTVVEDLLADTSPLTDGRRVDLKTAAAVLDNLGDLQPLRSVTRSTHGIAILDPDCRVLSTGEDIGRHNAMDKAIGRLFLDENLASAVLVLLSSRISFEMVQKAARARIPILFSLSRPTALAVDLARSLNMTLAGLGKDDNIYVYANGFRLSLAPEKTEAASVG